MIIDSYIFTVAALVVLLTVFAFLFFLPLNVMSLIDEKKENGRGSEKECMKDIRRSLTVQFLPTHRSFSPDHCQIPPCQ